MPQQVRGNQRCLRKKEMNWFTHVFFFACPFIVLSLLFCPYSKSPVLILITPNFFSLYKYFFPRGLEQKKKFQESPLNGHKHIPRLSGKEPTIYCGNTGPQGLRSKTMISESVGTVLSDKLCNVCVVSRLASKE